MEQQDIDVFISQYVLRHTVIRERKGGIKERTRLGHIRPLRPYSKDLSSAWEVMERLAITLIPIQGGEWFALVGQEGGWTSPAELFKFLQTGEFVTAGAAVADTPARAICLAALRSVGKKEGLDFEGVPKSDHTPDATTVGEAQDAATDAEPVTASDVPVEPLGEDTKTVH